MTVEENPRLCAGEEISSLIEHCFKNLKGPVTRVTHHMYLYQVPTYSKIIQFPQWN